MIGHKARKAPTAEERRHMQAVAAVGCLLCGAPASLHHVMHCAGKARRRDHRYVVPLCEPHHQGRWGVHGLGSEAAFAEQYDIDLAAWAVAEWEGRARA